MLSNPLLQPQSLLPLKPFNMPLVPPPENSKIRIMKIGLIQLFLLSLKHDVDEKSLIIEPPIYFIIHHMPHTYIFTYIYVTKSHSKNSIETIAHI